MSQSLQSGAGGEAVGKWPTVSGTIYQADLRATGKNSYAPDVIYHYFVNGNRYRGSRLRVWDGSTNLNSAQDYISGLSKDQMHPVSYDPKDPNHSVLFPGVSVQDYLLLVVPLGMTGIAGGLLLSLRKAK